MRPTEHDDIRPNEHDAQELERLAKVCDVPEVLVLRWAQGYPIRPTMARRLALNCRAMDLVLEGFGQP